MCGSVECMCLLTQVCGKDTGEDQVKSGKSNVTRKWKTVSRKGLGIFKCYKKEKKREIRDRRLPVEFDDMKASRDLNLSDLGGETAAQLNMRGSYWSATACSEINSR